MSAHEDSTPKAPATRARRARRRPARAPRPSRFPAGSEAPEGSASSHFHLEKARRANRPVDEDHPLEQARRAYHALLAADAERARGGRPKGATKSAAAKAGAARAAARRETSSAADRDE